MKKIILNSTLLLIILSLLSCGDDDSPVPVLSSGTAASQAISVVSGTVISNKRDTVLTTGEIVWEVTVQTSSGSEVSMEFFEQGGALREISGEDAPFDYEVTPGMGLIAFSVAKATALSEMDGEIVSWELDQNSEGTWIYKIKITLNGITDEVKINAGTGAVI
jgi:hypothetical protein